VKPRRALAVIAAYLLVGATVLVGWMAGLQQLLDEGWIAGGGTGWLLGAASLATIAAAAAAWQDRRGHPRSASVCLLVVAASSPTVFAYPLNLAVIFVALVVIGRGIATRPVRGGVKT
jgi:hypothetical protein